jgi:hypothetical protein
VIVVTGVCACVLPFTSFSNLSVLVADVVDDAVCCIHQMMWIELELLSTCRHHGSLVVSLRITNRYSQRLVIELGFIHVSRTVELTVGVCRCHCTVKQTAIDDLVKLLSGCPRQHSEGATTAAVVRHFL